MFSPPLARALAFTLAALPAAHAGENQVGGKTVDTAQIYVETGFPHTEVGGRIPVGPVELSPVVRFGYAFSVGSAGALSLSPGIGLRAQLLRKERWSGALTARLPIHITFQGGVGAGIGLLTPGFAATWHSRPVDVDLGIRFEDDLYFVGNQVAFAGAFPVLFGLNFTPKEKISLGVRVEAGPWFSVFGGATTTDLLFRGVIGLGFSL